MPKVYIIIVNWNGWQDTIECLESVFRLKYENFCVIVCDNGSSDGSMERLQEWAEGNLAELHQSPNVEPFGNKEILKPVPFAIVDYRKDKKLHGGSERLFLVPLGQNLGFAAANNVGLRLAMANGDLDYAWLLNNDTVVDCEALSEQIARMKEDDAPGICGATIIYYDHPKVIQALGGARYGRWTARVHHIGSGHTVRDFPSQYSQYDVEREIDYVLGASMLVSFEFLSAVGLMNEQFFLFFEEIDWCTRGRTRFRLAYSARSIVYHKQGRSTGESLTSKNKLNQIGGYYGPRNRVMFTRIHHPIALPTVLTAILASIVRRITFGQFATVKTLVSGIVAGLFEPLNQQGGIHAE